MNKFPLLTDSKQGSGFVLLEVVMALAFLGLAMLTISSLFIRNYRTVATAGAMSEVLFTARKQMEMEISNPPTDPPPTILPITFGQGVNEVSIEVKGNLLTVQESTNIYHRRKDTGGAGSTEGFPTREIKLKTFIYSGP
ncbi:MAG TPA: hypothetical protein VLH40_08265 [Atribacteraceae bacterium]|nr:hypothetical protein [Atribacteraceae bacterium]